MQPALNRVANSGWLLEDFLEHEVRIPLPFSHLCGPRYDLRFPERFASGKIPQLSRLSAQNRDFSIIQEKHAASVGQEGRDVRSHKVLSLGEADYQRRTVADGNESERFVSTHDDHAEDAFHVLQSRQNSPLEIPLVTRFNQMRQDFSIGGSAEAMALSTEPASQFPVVFDYAVMYDDEIARTIAVRMRILLACCAVRRPTRVSYCTHRSVHRDGTRLKLFLEAANTADRAHNMRRTSIHHGDATRIVPAVFQPL